MPGAFPWIYHTDFESDIYQRSNNFLLWKIFLHLLYKWSSTSSWAKRPESKIYSSGFLFIFRVMKSLKTALWKYWLSTNPTWGNGSSKVCIMLCFCFCDDKFLFFGWERLALWCEVLPQEDCCESHAALTFCFYTYKSTIDHKTQPVITITNI